MEGFRLFVRSAKGHMEGFDLRTIGKGTNEGFDLKNKRDEKTWRGFHLSVRSARGHMRGSSLLVLYLDGDVGIDGGGAALT